MVLKSLWIVESSSASAWILEQLARMVRGASLLGSTRLNKRKRGLRRVGIESPVPALDTTAAIILNTESPGVVSCPAKAYPQKNHR
jgi:hypothetical protein